MIIALLSGKGGVGKSTIIANLGKELARELSRVLLIDSDFFTQGLSFSMARGKYSFDFSFEDLILENDQVVFDPSQEKCFFKISPCLYLLPSLKGLFNSRKGRHIEDALHGRLRDLRKILREVQTTYGFDFILIDTRSGPGFLSIFPALLSDTFWVITEEDVVSQEISNVLLQIIEEHANEEKIGTNLGAFLVNKSLTLRMSNVQILMAFLERTVFRAPCVSIMPLNVKVRQAFLSEKFAIDTCPNSVFSKEIAALAEGLRNRYIPSLLKRLQSYNVSRKLVRVAYPVLSMFGIVALAVGFVGFFLFMGLGIDPVAAIPLLMVLIGLTGAVGAFLFFGTMREE